MLKINWYRLLPWAYTILCWILLCLFVTQEEWAYLYALGAVVITFSIGLFCSVGAGKTRTS